jgi:hypothetical protein
MDQKDGVRATGWSTGFLEYLCGLHHQIGPTDTPVLSLVVVIVLVAWARSKAVGKVPCQPRS